MSGGEPEAVTFQVTTYKKLPKGATGLTRIGSRRIAASQVLDWVLAELPEDAVKVVDPDAEPDKVVVTINWSKVPAAIRDPKIPAARR